MSHRNYPTPRRFPRQGCRGELAVIVQSGQPAIGNSAARGLTRDQVTVRRLLFRIPSYLGGRMRDKGPRFRPLARAPVLGAKSRLRRTVVARTMALVTFVFGFSDIRNKWRDRDIPPFVPLSL